MLNFAVLFVPFLTVNSYEPEFLKMLSFMEMNDLGLTSTEEHFFKDWVGDNVIMSYN